MSVKLRNARRILLLILGLSLIPPTVFFGVRWQASNFETLRPERIYRSGQMTSATLARTIRERGIKTVLNLRGVNPGESWYRNERKATTDSGATLVDVSMSSCQWMSRAQLKAVVKILDECDYPLMIHCQWGAERTGLISAYSELLRSGSTLADAKAQFSLYYMFLPYKDGLIMWNHIDRYERWLNERQASHSPERFREWVQGGYVPERPGREEWPYDPYPLVVVSRPETEVRSTALRKDDARDARPR